MEVPWAEKQSVSPCSEDKSPNLSSRYADSSHATSFEFLYEYDTIRTKYRVHSNKDVNGTHRTKDIEK